MKRNNEIINVGRNLCHQAITTRHLLGTLKSIVKGQKNKMASMAILLCCVIGQAQAEWIKQPIDTKFSHTPLDFVSIGAINSQSTGSYYEGFDPSKGYVTARMLRVVFEGGSATWSGNNPVNDTTTGECFLSILVDINGTEKGRPIINFRQSDGLFPNDAMPNKRHYYIGEQWIKMNRPCAEVRPNAPDFPQLLPVPSFTGYILTGKNIEDFYYPRRGSDMSYSYHVVDVDRVYARIWGVACPQPQLINGKCTLSDFTQSYDQPVAPIPKKSCDIVMPREIKYVDLSKSNYLGARVDEKIQVVCNEPSSIKFMVPDTVTVGPFKLNVTVDEAKNPTVLVAIQADLKLSTEIISVEGELAPGEYTGSIVIVTTVI